MDLESRIRDQLNTELTWATATSGSPEKVIKRGRRRRLAYRTSQALAVAAAVVLAVATTALIVNVMDSPKVAASPFTGAELPVISRDPLVVQAAPGLLVGGEPSGTEVALLPIIELLPHEAEGLAAIHANPEHPIVAIGEVASTGERLFALYGPNTRHPEPDSIRFVAYRGAATAVWDVEIGPGAGTGVVPTPEGQLLVGRLSAEAAWVQVDLPAGLVWQRPAESLVVFPLVFPTTGEGLISVRDANGTVLSEVPMLFGTDEPYVAPPPGTINDWVNSLGLQQMDEQLWATRLTAACEEGVWDREVAERLATQFIAEDMALFVGGEGAPEPTAPQGAQALWRMSAQYCPETFPPGEIEAGPFMIANAERLADDLANRDPWIEAAAAPIGGRYAHASDWTGDHVLIWGGISRPSEADPELSDGARYHPEQNLWRVLPPAPEGMSGRARSVWTGSAWIVRTDHVPNGPMQMASYDPIADAWTEIESDLTPGESYAMVWTGEEVVIYGGTSGDVLTGGTPVAYNPDTDTWRQLPTPPIEARTSPVALWTGNELIIWGGTASCSSDSSSTCTEFATDGAAYDPATDSWRKIANNQQVEIGNPVRGWAWTGTELLVLYSSECDDGVCLTGHALHVAHNEWRAMPDLVGAADPANRPVWVTGDGFRSLLYLWDRTGAGFSYHAVDDQWTALGPYPMADRFGATVVPIGPQVFVWGGWDGAAANEPFADGFVTIP